MGLAEFAFEPEVQLLPGFGEVALGEGQSGHTLTFTYGPSNVK